MDKLVVVGGIPLNGVIRISGAKNAVLPILAATLLTEKPVILSNIPHLNDVSAMIKLLNHMGAHIAAFDRQMSIKIDCSSIQHVDTSYELVKTMRASILILGPLLTRFREVEISLPGGCAIGSRPVDIHINGMQVLGANVTLVDGSIRASVDGRLKGKKLNLEKITVTGTENLIMAASLAEGQTIIHNAACEPEVQDLANFLNGMGARISGAGTNTITIDGVDRLFGGRYHILPDRIEAGTYLVAAAMTRGHIRIKDVLPKTLWIILKKLHDVGAKIKIGKNWIDLDMKGRRPKAVNITTAPYPKMPTDMQAQFMALNVIAEGNSIIKETVFENRFMHAYELQRMGADVELRGRKAFIRGKEKLTGVSVIATDLRASAGLVLAGLMAQGNTIINRIFHIDRGYECIEEKLAQLGAEIRRVPSSPPMHTYGNNNGPEEE
ncbi:UDP-N-acetylglucosamine 1-carboxyvinyltransferase [Coxiella endosymbiont of Amblyomma americanum]|uniref:UDP-N-acetylglucosamine 1-carboxyvinyltransferase n=1 Tax=Coxiella endosymbiont of Amblyomma americanum TaxID=325775 RepID=UPI000581F5AF|nr:UDP-N-acetylglucosamine 1-carboxyvinyltransferase [Coxiella endosymbiont of Amblyomma americanum]AJC50348.1 UDP-N-acetylglucosamine 1-carboxyvinyltransferase [Coxiella endosymbiont of Amblyomma americanum]AUJ58695.1 UDP-N-acetylglucosamine 1-carboxyvinyltransferase [Coxiella-like endosymbiont of Amblyomma americanum]